MRNQGELARLNKLITDVQRIRPMRTAYAKRDRRYPKVPGVMAYPGRSALIRQTDPDAQDIPHTPGVHCKG